MSFDRPRTRSFNLVLTCLLAGILGLWAVPAHAEEPEEIVGGEELAFEQVIVSEVSTQNNDELLADYIQQQFDAQLPEDDEAGPQRAHPGPSKLSSDEAYIYEILAEGVASVARGDTSSTVFGVVVDSLAEQTTWTASELGVSTLVNEAGTDFTAEAKTAAFNKFYEQLDLDPNMVNYELLMSNPYEMFWHDKTVGSVLGMSRRFRGNSQTLTIYNVTISFKFEVAEEFRTDEITVDSNGVGHYYHVDTTKIPDVDDAVAVAQDVVASQSEASLYDRLAAYKDWICDHVDYNHYAADDDNEVAYGNPWQLVWVFDDDPSTTVVCEGYAKAFQYLCDLSGLANTYCYSVSGEMDGGTGAGGHMWNIVAMPDGKNYMVDVTNCDDDATGEHLVDDVALRDGLFMKAPASGDASTEYVFDSDELTLLLTYAYDAKTQALYTEEELTLADTDYDPSFLPPDPISIEDAEVAVDPPTYTGSPLEPVPTVTLEGVSLTLGTDFTVTYGGDNVNAGEDAATLTITGQGAHTGTKTVTFSIRPQELRPVRVTLSPTSFTYDGTQKTPTVTVRVGSGSGTLLDESRYEVYLPERRVDRGRYQVRVNLTGNYAGSGSAEFTINPKQIPVPVGKALTYNGQPQLGVDEGEGYVLSNPTPATDAGNYATTVHLADMNNTVWRGVGTSRPQTIAWSIAPASIDGAELTLSSATFTYDGEVQKPAVTAVGGEALVDGIDFTAAYADPESADAGTYTVTVEGKGNYAGTSAAASYEIAARSIEGASVTLASDEEAYTGSPIEPAVTSVTLDGVALGDGDYDVAYDENTNVGEGSVIVSGKGNYTGTATTTFSIVGRVAHVEVNPAETLVYTGESQTGAYEGEGYTIAGNTGTDAQEYTAVATLETGYMWEDGSVEPYEIKWEIRPADIAEAEVDGIPAQPWSGTGPTPEPAVTWHGKALVKDADYTLSYAYDQDAGTGTVTIAGKGNFTNSTTAGFELLAPTAIDIASDDVEVRLTKDSHVYTGSQIEPDLQITHQGTPLVAGTDYTLAYGENTDVGEGSVTITGQGNYTGTKTVTFGITRKSVTVTAQAASKTYGAKDPTLTAKVSGTVGGDKVAYTLTRAKGEKAGAYAISVTGAKNQGNYQVTFVGGAKLTIKAAAISKATAARIANQTYTGKALKPKPKLTFNGVTLKEGADYKLGYTKNTAAGTATITVTGLGNFTGTRALAFKIAAASLKAAKVASIPVQYANGKAIKPTPKVTLGSKTLRLGTDYALSYQNNTKVGTARLTVTGKGNYAGSLTRTFKIEARWQRLAGANAVGTMQAIVRADGVFTTANVDTIIVAGRRDFKAALAGTGLAGLYRAPLLITEPASLSGGTKTELQRLKPSRVIVCGDTSVVSAAAFNAIKAAVPAATVTRVAGTTPSATAVAIHAAGKRANTSWGKAAIVATQSAYKDALSIAPYSYVKHAPIFFTESTSMGDGKGLSAATLDAIKKGGFTQVYIVGGSLAVPESVASQLKGISVTRIAGANAIETSKLIGRFELSQGMTIEYLSVATTQDYADALAGASLAGAQNSVLVLANQTGGYAAFDALAKGTGLRHGHVLGGEFAISAASEAYFFKR